MLVKTFFFFFFLWSPGCPVKSILSPFLEKAMQIKWIPGSGLLVVACLERNNYIFFFIKQMMIQFDKPECCNVTKKATVEMFH